MSKEIPIEDDTLMNMNFTKVTDLDMERKVFGLYKRFLIYILKRFEAETTLE